MDRYKQHICFTQLFLQIVYQEKPIVLLMLSINFRSSLEKEPVTLGPLTAETKTGNTSTSLKGSQVYKFQHWTK